MKNPILLIALVLVVCAACSPSDDPGYTDGWLDADSPVDGTDTATGCTSTTPYCSADNLSVVSCNPATGMETTVQVCSTGQACVGGACVTVACVPGTFDCLDGSNQRICRSDGSGYDTVYCGDGLSCVDGHCEEICALRVFILVDQSGSMGGDTSPTKWEQARTAISTLMTSPAASEVEFGFGTFPSDGDCAADDIVHEPIPTATSSSVNSYFTSNGPSGNTPLTFSMQFFETDSTAGLKDSSYHNALLVVSDGSDTCYVDCTDTCGLFDIACLMACESDAEALAVAQLSMIAANLRDTYAIRTFVIGFGEGANPNELQAIAGNGGTVLGEWILASDVGALTVALQQIIDEMHECNDIII
jgi:hypothetical protein